MNQEIVEFAGSQILTVKKNETIYVAIKPICEAIGIDYSAQIKSLKNDEALNHLVAQIATRGSDGRNFTMVAIPLNYLNGWLFKIQTFRIKNQDAKEMVLKYQRECYQVLAEHFMNAQKKQDMIDVSPVAQHLHRLARKFAAYCRYEIKSRIMDARHLTPELVGQLAAEAQDFHGTYAGFEESLWDVADPSPEMEKLVIKLAEEKRLGWLENL